MFGDLDCPLNASRGLSAIAVFLVTSVFDVTVDRVESLMHISRHGCDVAYSESTVRTVTTLYRYFRKLSLSVGSFFLLIALMMSKTQITL